MNSIINIGILGLNILFGFMKLLPVKKKITYISRQMNTVPVDFQMTAECIQKKAPKYKQVILAKVIPDSVWGKIRYCFHILRQMYHIATSEVVILDTYCIPISILKQRKQLVVIQMWHALGALKKFGYSILDQKEGRSSKQAKLMHMHQNYTYVLASSQYSAVCFSEAFRVPLEKVRIYPLPKTDILLDEIERKRIKEEIYHFYPQLKDSSKKVIVYAPTFRKKEKGLYDAIKKFIEKIDFEQYEFILKKHPLVEFDIGDERIIEDNKFSSLEFFHVADLIVTDYSAVLFEALMLKKPIYFYAYDFEQYKDERSFYVDYKREMPGPVIEDAGELVMKIKENIYDYDRAKEFEKKMVAECKKSYTEDFVEFLLQNIK